MVSTSINDFYFNTDVIKCNFMRPGSLCALSLFTMKYLKPQRTKQYQPRPNPSQPNCAVSNQDLVMS